MWQRHLLQVILLIALCTALAFVDALRSYTAAYYNGTFYLEWRQALRWDLFGWSVWVLFIPLILSLSRRWLIDRSNWPRRLPCYLAGGLLVALVKTFFPLLIYAVFLQSIADISAWLSRKPYFLVTDFVFALAFYGLVLAFAQARNYYRQYREEELRASRLESQLAKAELQALRMQLQPHFLFNTLHSISALQLEDVAAAQTMTARLGDFLRLTLEGAGVQEVPLRREVEFLKCYLDIERVRFGRRLTTEIAIAPDVWEAWVPNLILQPLVENAIRHGIAPRAAPGHISVTAARAHGLLKIEVRDNGCGLKLNGHGAGYFEEGVGLANTRARLQQLYGAHFQLAVANAPEGGLVVTLGLPVLNGSAPPGAGGH